jgi:phosphoribosylanthranilate isomerase
MTEFKICGIRNVESALTAAYKGASLLGFVFVQGVPRELTTEQANKIIGEYRLQYKKNAPKLVGVFANQPLEEVNYISQQCGLDLVQLCGNESSKYWHSLKLPAIKQVKVPNEGSKDEIIANLMEKVDEVSSHGLIPLLDTNVSGSLGGTGRSFDWDLAIDLSKRYQIFLAGGLTPENVSDAIFKTTPWGVDVSSGVETNGEKDSRKISAFAKAVKNESCDQ